MSTALGVFWMLFAAAVGDPMVAGLLLFSGSCCAATVAHYEEFQPQVKGRKGRRGGS